ncbi:MAG: RNA 2',3'-cyclic phosphodiesterase [Candidatus Altiarchaeota archaeon]|nr:RNA 2',3'-cyclic phosphodiesterase [Candidatus Altiarchaeota archaeon]
MARAFIAVPCPEELRKGLIEIQDKIKGFGKMRLVEPENIHMTLKFLGEVDERRFGEITNALDSVSENQGFELSLKGVGVFPNKSYVRVIWVGVDNGQDTVMRIQKRIDDVLVSCGFNRDNRFHPHFTLARVKSVDKSKLGKYLEDNSGLELGGFYVNGVDLMESLLSPKGPTYSVIKTFKFFSRTSNKHTR